MGSNLVSTAEHSQASLNVGDQIILHPESQAGGGTSLARTDSGIVFVSGAIPGESVRAQILEVKKGFAQAQVTEVLEASEHRVCDRRDLLGASGVGGMEFAHVDLAHSRTLKEQAAADQFTRIGGLEQLPRVLAATNEAQAGDSHDAEVHSADALAGTTWRTRSQLAVHDGQPGFLAARSHTVLAVDELPLAVNQLTDFGLQHLHVPGVERIELAASSESGAVILTGEPSAGAIESVLASLEDSDWSLLHRAAGKRNRGAGHRSVRGAKARGARRAARAGDASGASLRVLRGGETLTQNVAGLSFTLQADGFWQVHVDAAQVLSEAVVTAAAGAHSVVDLYCGAGLFSVRLARDLQVPVVGVEGSEAAVAAARRNLDANVPGAPAEFLTARVERMGDLPTGDVIVVDPPRAGLGAAVVDSVVRSAARRLVYVSCDGGTFARDARRLIDAGFTLSRTVGHDLFPLTAHTEFVSVFDR